MDEQFLTLSASSTSDSGVSDPYDDSTPLSTPPTLSATHDTSRSSFHLQDLETFTKDLQSAANRAFPNEGRSQPRYNSVSVLLLRWEDDEMNVDWELEDLEKVFMEYGFDTEQWLIPRKNAHLKLMSKVVDLVEIHDGREDLVVVYYAGHAFINSQRQATWSCKSDPIYASLEWSAIQTLFEKAHFDVLLLLDCCAAASAAPTVGSAVTETIAACGFESIAPQPGRHSFTNTLIEVLEDWIDCPLFSAAMLHNKVLSLLKHERPERMQNGKRRRLECRRTPIHIVGTANPRLPSIELGRRTNFKLQIPALETPPSTLNTTCEIDDTPNPVKQKGYQIDALNNIKGDDYDIPRVIISLALEKHQTLSSDSCQKWLASCPALVKYATVQAVYKGFSALILLSIPVCIWDLLPEHPACSFVGYVTSHNLHRPGTCRSIESDLSTATSTQKEDLLKTQDTATSTKNPRADNPHSLPSNGCFFPGNDESTLPATEAHNSKKSQFGRETFDMLEREYQKNPRPFAERKRQIAETLGVGLDRINNWFQNRRAKKRQQRKQRIWEEAQRDLGYSSRSATPESIREETNEEAPMGSCVLLECPKLDCNPGVHKSAKTSLHPIYFSKHLDINSEAAIQNRLNSQNPTLLSSMEPPQRSDCLTDTLPTTVRKTYDPSSEYTTLPGDCAWEPQPENQYAKGENLPNISLDAREALFLMDSTWTPFGISPQQRFPNSPGSPDTSLTFPNEDSGYHSGLLATESNVSPANLSSVSGGSNSKSPIKELGFLPMFEFTNFRVVPPFPSRTASNSCNMPTRLGPNTNSSSFAPPSQDWTRISDLAERRRLQNLRAQRNYRMRLKKRIEDLERRAGLSETGQPPTDEERHGYPKDNDIGNEEPRIGPRYWEQDRPSAPQLFSYYTYQAPSEVVCQETYSGSKSGPCADYLLPVPVSLPSMNPSAR